VLTTDKTTYVSHQGRLPDLLAYLQRETELTRKTLYEILAESGRLAEFPVNPQRFMMEVAKLINISLNKLVLDEIE
jgi:type III restriction enzyme